MLYLYYVPCLTGVEGRVEDGASGLLQGLYWDCNQALYRDEDEGLHAGGALIIPNTILQVPPCHYSIIYPPKALFYLLRPLYLGTLIVTVIEPVKGTLIVTPYRTL